MSIATARAARAQQSLDKQVRLSTGEVVTKRDLMRRLHAQGATLKPWRKHKPVAEEALRAKVERLSRGWSVPIGNPNHPDTIEFRALEARLKAGVYEDVLTVETQDGVFYEVSKAEADYFASLGGAT